MKIDRVLVGCYFGDYWFAKICVASIRRWYPDIRISLLKDVTYQKFDTSEVETYWCVDSVEVEGYGNPSAKIESFRMPCDRFLFLDSDIVMVGPVIDHLNSYEEDIVISGSFVEDPNSEHIKEFYYTYENLKKLDPSFKYPGFAFNTGQFAAKQGVVDFDEIMQYFTRETTKNHVKYSDVFIHNEQGILSYLLPKMQQRGDCSLAHDPFKLNAVKEVIADLDYKTCTSGEGIPHIIHWMGEKGDEIDNFERADILRYYRDFYCSKTPGGVKQFESDLHNCSTFKKRQRFAKRIYMRLPKCMKQIIQKFI